MSLQKANKLIKSSALVGITTLITLMSGCGGGGGSSAPTLYYPYEDVFGNACSKLEASPGCTFLRSTGERITVSEDSYYNVNGNGSDDIVYVIFDDYGVGSVYTDDSGKVDYTLDISQFSGWISGNTIGVGVTGLHWEDVSRGTYWWGKNGVLYNANDGEANFSRAINDTSASEAVDTNFSALNSEGNKALVQAGTDKLVDEYGLGEEKAYAIASALNRWGVAASERGFTTTKDMNTTFNAVFGVNFDDALAAFNGLRNGDPTKMQAITLRSASANGLKPHMAKKFVKGVYKKALANWGYEDINW